MVSTRKHNDKPSEATTTEKGVDDERSDGSTIPTLALKTAAAAAAAGRSTRSSGVEPMFAPLDDIEKIMPKPQKKRKHEQHEFGVTKVKLLTGTLYLYRGPQQRVAFVPSK